MPTINGVINEVNPFKSPLVINGAKTRVVNGLRPTSYDKWKMRWNGHMFAPPEPSSVLYLPGIPGFGSTIFDYSWNFSDSGIDTNEALDATETGVDCDADASTTIPVGSIIDVEGELMKVTGTGVSLTVIRGYHGSIATTHDTNKDIYVWTPNDGTITGATWLQLPSGLAYQSYDGNDWVNLGTDSGIAGITGSFTVKIWSRPTSTSGIRAFACQKTGAVPVWEITWVNALFARATIGGLDSGFISGAASINKWNHTGITHDGTTLKLYLNGALLDSVVKAGNLDAGTQVEIGRRKQANDTYDAYFAGGQNLPLILSGVAWSAEDWAISYNQERHLFGV